MSAASSSSKGLFAGAATVAALGVLYVSGYLFARTSHVLVHYEEWGAHEDIHRIDTGSGSERLTFVRFLYEPLIVIEEGFWSARRR